MHRLWENNQITPQESTEVGLEIDYVAWAIKSIKDDSRMETDAHNWEKIMFPNNL